MQIAGKNKGVIMKIEYKYYLLGFNINEFDAEFMVS